MSKKKVLVIDDEDFIRELVKDFLEMEDIPCDSAENSEEGLDLINRNRYNLILLDRNLGKSKAEDIIEQIRKIDTDTPILLLTGDTDCNDEYLERVGAVGIVFKPFQVTDFIEKVTKFLENE
jgi:two-component system alkaline phosphatase synthesis response regulator PhoP